MNSAKSNNRAARFQALQASDIFSSGKPLIVPDVNQHQLIITAGVMRLLGPANDGSIFPVMTVSNPGDTWKYVGFRNEGPKLLINGVGSRGAGSRVKSIIGLGETPDGSLEEAIRVMLISLRYPILVPDQVKSEHRELLGKYGYIK